MQTGEKHIFINSIFFTLLLLSGHLTILRKKKCTRLGKQTQVGREVIRVWVWAAKADRI